MNTKQPKEEIIAELRAKQARKRKALDELDMAIATLSIPAFFPAQKGHKLITVNKTVITADELLQSTAEDLIFKFNEICAREKCSLSDLKVVNHTTFHWEDTSSYMSIDMSIERLETDEERQERWDDELVEHNIRWSNENKRLLEQHTKVRKSLVRNLNNLVEAELRLLGDDTQYIKDQALAKLTEAERMALGLVQ